MENILVEGVDDGMRYNESTNYIQIKNTTGDWINLVQKPDWEITPLNQSITMNAYSTYYYIYACYKPYTKLNYSSYANMPMTYTIHFYTNAGLEIHSVSLGSVNGTTIHEFSGSIDISGADYNGSDYMCFRIHTGAAGNNQYTNNASWNAIE